MRRKLRIKGAANKKFSFPHTPMKGSLKLIAVLISASFCLKASAATITVNNNDSRADSLRTALALGATPTPTPTCTPSQFHVLVVYADSLPPIQLQGQILAELGVTTVDLFDAASGTPTLGPLQQYQIVVPLSNIGAPGFLDATTLGNNLADYVDGGGLVV